MPWIAPDRKASSIANSNKSDNDKAESMLRELESLVKPKTKSGLLETYDKSSYLPKEKSGRKISRPWVEELEKEARKRKEKLDEDNKKIRDNWIFFGFLIGCSVLILIVWVLAGKPSLLEP